MKTLNRSQLMMILAGLLASQSLWAMGRAPVVDKPLDPATLAGTFVYEHAADFPGKDMEFYYDLQNCGLDHVTEIRVAVTGELGKDLVVDIQTDAAFNHGGATFDRLGQKPASSHSSGSEASSDHYERQVLAGSSLAQERKDFRTDWFSIIPISSATYDAMTYAFDTEKNELRICHNVMSRLNSKQFNNEENWPELRRCDASVKDSCVFRKAQ